MRRRPTTVKLPPAAIAIEEQVHHLDHLRRVLLGAIEMGDLIPRKLKRCGKEQASLGFLPLRHLRFLPPVPRNLPRLPSDLIKSLSQNNFLNFSAPMHRSGLRNPGYQLSLHRVNKWRRQFRGLWSSQFANRQNNQLSLAAEEVFRGPR